MLTDQQQRVLKTVTLYNSIENAKNEIYQRHADWPCGAGCSYCCYRSVFLVSRVEWEIMLAGIRELYSPEEQRSLQQRAQKLLRTKFSGSELEKGWYQMALDNFAIVLKCPLLDGDGRCSIYEYRPSICRAYGYYTSNNPRLKVIHGCPIINEFVADPKNGVGQMPSMDPLTEEMETHLWGDSRIIVAWLADEREFQIADV